MIITVGVEIVSNYFINETNFVPLLLQREERKYRAFFFKNIVP